MPGAYVKVLLFSKKFAKNLLLVSRIISVS